MMIELNERWVMVPSEDSIILIKKTPSKKTGKLRVTGASRRYYYPSWETALDGMINRDFLGLDTLEDIVSRIDDLKKDLKNLQPCSCVKYDK